MGALCEHYRWPPDFWRRMGWRELQGWLRERERSLIERAEGERTSVDSWDKRGRDPWWEEARRRG